MMMLERHIDEVFNKKYQPLENKNLHKIFDYCKEIIKHIDFYVDYLFDGGYYGQGVKSEWFERELKDGISIWFGLDYDGLNMKLKMSDKFYREHEKTDYPDKSKAGAEFELTNKCKQEMGKYLLKYWKDIKPDLNKLVKILKNNSESYKINLEQKQQKEKQEEDAWKKEMEEFEV